MDPVIFSQQELTLVADATFFPAKAEISRKIRCVLDNLLERYRDELRRHTLLAPPQLTLDSVQFVKGDHLEEFPYQYLDFPRYYTRSEKFAFRSLFWWGHHMAFALILEGGALRRYKENLINRYADVADKGLCLHLGSNLWEWKHGTGYTLELTRDRKPEAAAILANRPFFKLTRFVHADHFPHAGQKLVDYGHETLRTLLPVITP